ncbi:uncharacterized protein JN550_013154 [Neoarthrinium moseri]|uniref:uncharacterized protein n=1 Tax=Neoarthrinium moseri TaxID=1658444 RepID=UPI001FDC459E|nr:uncharacterized protein JN550_013154 [Neoarthrinium moseri]KAI1857585.1 hypothetical protein JN550_013154 [Neoarthrinium moseri]
MVAAIPSKAQGRFSSYGLPTPSLAEKPNQSMAAPFRGSLWKSEGIWGNNGNNKSVIGGGLSQRDPPGSRGSDDTSPTAPSGSAQLNHQSEAETPTWGTRNGIWSTQENPVQGRPASGSTSPGQIRDSSLAQHGAMQESQYFQSRVGQNENTFSSRTKGHGTMDKFTPVFGGMVNEEPENTFSPMAKYSFANPTPFKRGSQVQDPGFPTLGQMRNNNMIPTSRADPLNQDLSQNSFESLLPGNPRGSVSRPSVQHHSLSYPSNGGPTRGLASVNPGIDQELSGILGNSLGLRDNPDVDANGLAANGYLNPQSQAFQFNPSSQAWNGDLPSTGRGFGQGYSQNDSYVDAVAASYVDSKRNSIERGSPSSASFHRASLNSPRFTPGSGSRPDSWSGSRPISRNHAMPQEFERQQIASQFPPNSGFYPNAPYYGNNFGGQFNPSLTPYDLYGQNAGFRGQMPISSYHPMVNQYIAPLNPPQRPSRDQDPGKGVRSQQLEEFRNSNRSSKRWELKDIYSYVVEFSGDQHGSRFIQEKLQNANSDEKDQVFQEIQRNALQLMKDVFGNYVIQKFFEHGSQVQKTILARQMKGKVAELSTQMYACRVVQKALEHVLVDQQEEIVEELKPDILRIVKDQNGNHVIQKIISLVPRICVPFMMTAFRGQINNLAAHNYGCRVVQRMLEQGTEEERRDLMDEVHACAPQLITDQYGNYVAQHIVQHGSDKDRARTISLVIDQLIEYSIHKFASNVVEKCVEFGTDEERKIIKTKLVTADAKGNHPLDRVMIDQYGNYVLQKVVGRLDAQDRDDLLIEVQQRFAILRQSTVSGRQMAAIERLLGNYEPKSSASSQTASKTPAAAATRGLQIDVNSSAPTPALTTENGSPESSSPPSTNLGDDAIVENGKTDAITQIGGQPHVVEADETEH